MSTLVVLTYDTPEGAPEARAAIHSLEQQGQIRVTDSAVVVRDTDGQVHHKGQIDEGVKIGAVGGSVVGLLVTFMFPIAGIIGGALVGAGIGKALGTHVDRGFVDEVTATLTPGTSAIFIISKETDPGVLIQALRGHAGHIYHTNLDEEAEEALADAIKG
jgi:uncharacterized membrane protein